MLCSVCYVTVLVISPIARSFAPGGPGAFGTTVANGADYYWCDTGNDCYAGGIFPDSLPDIQRVRFSNADINPASTYPGPLVITGGLVNGSK